jgi:hypothetical protein
LFRLLFGPSPDRAGQDTPSARRLQAREERRRLRTEQQQRPRSHERRIVSITAANIRADIHNDQGELGEGILWDVSRGGLCLLIAGELQLLQESSVLLRVHTGFDASVLELPSLVRWCAPSPNQTFAGFAFDDCELPSGCFLDRFLT